jgi:hypothetical protein
LGQDDDTIAQMDGAGTPESLTPVNSKEPSPEVSADTSDQIDDNKETEILMILEKILQQENYDVFREQNIKVNLIRGRRQSMGYLLRSSTAFEILEEYHDEEFSDQGSIYGDAAEDHFVNQLLKHLQHLLNLKHVLLPQSLDQQEVEAAWTKYPLLNLYYTWQSW